PCERSSTGSFSGQRVSPMRRRRSSSASCGTSTVNGRISVWVGAWTAMGALLVLVTGRRDATSGAPESLESHDCRCRLNLLRCERRAQLVPRRDAELREQAVQVRADGAVRKVEALADLAVAQPFRGQLGNLELLRRELVASLLAAPASGFAGSTDLLARPFCV